MTGRWAIDGREVRLTNLDKALFPAEPPITKRELIRYHALIAPFMLPYLADRPVNTHRFPDSVPALVWMANFGAIELHPWTSRPPHVHQPSWALIDIDPGASTSFDDILALARLYRTALDHLGVAGTPKVTGQRGIQIWIPVQPGYNPRLGQESLPGRRPDTAGPGQISRDELDDPNLRPDRWTIRTVLDRVRQTGDPLAALIGTAQRLPRF